MKKTLVLLALIATVSVSAVPITFSSGESFGPGTPTASMSFGGIYDDAMGPYGSILFLAGGYGGLGSAGIGGQVYFPDSGSSLSLTVSDFGGFGTIMGLGALTSDQQRADLLSGLAFATVRTAANPDGEVAAKLVLSGGSRVPDGGVPLAMTGLVFVGMAVLNKRKSVPFV
ncbi:MAG TPA: hypothetical protein VJW76_16880 [Verrucomicrobiae bacterium]|nr:hypothetical protein [Verrucomicrobiae bacterium]